MYQQLFNYFTNIEKNVSGLSQARKSRLQKVSNYLREKHKNNEAAKLTFICTHNSRRSLMCQIWATAIADYYGIEQVHTFSGGTEVTAFNPRAAAAFERAGFKVKAPKGKNPLYSVFYDSEAQPVEAFSKTFDDPRNPHNNFAAIMTCDEADRNCPFIPGASLRISLPYKDPKEADDTPDETQIYDDRCRQIATEMCYLMLQAKP